MNYNQYIDIIAPRAELKEITKSAVKKEIGKKNITARKKRTALLSTAACFAVLATTVYTAKTINNAPQVTDEPTKSESSITQQADEATSGNTTTIKLTTVPEKIVLNTKAPSNKYGAQKIKIDGKVYVQYCSNSKDKWGDDNGNFTIMKSDIGQELCTISAENLINLDNWYDYNSMTKSEAENCKFNKARVYEYNKCKNGTQLLVKANNEYYLFYLTDLVDKTEASEIFDIFTCSSSNAIKKIDVYQSIDINNENEKFLCSITDTDKIAQIRNILEACNENTTLKDVISRGYFDESADRYTLKITFDDATDLSIELNEKFFYFEIVQGNEYGCYLYSDNTYKKIISVIKKD